MTMPETVAAPETAPTAPETPPAPAAAVPDLAPKPARRSLEDSLTALDDETKAFVLGEVQKARSEAKGLRDRVKEADPAKIKAEFASALAKAMGVEAETAPDPAKLTADLASQTAEARAAKVELAIYRVAGSLEGDPARMLDSRSFMTSLANVDPTDAGALQDAIKTALEANPDLKAAPARRLPAPNPALGSSAAGAPDLETQIVAAQKAGDWKQVVALQNQKLANAPK